MLRSQLAAGTATGIGSLPHADARAAAALSLRCTPRLPAAPQLPRRSAAELMIAQWARGIPEVHAAADGSLVLDPTADRDAPIDTTFVPSAHGGLLGFLVEAARAPRPPKAVKVQVTGPLTLSLALIDAGVAPRRAFRRGAQAAAAWAAAVQELVASSLPGAGVVLLFDEPGLVAWRGADPPADRDVAVDILSGTLAAPDCLTGVHACGDADVRIALEAGPAVLAVEAGSHLIDDAVPIGRHLEGEGWIAWGAVPTDRPVGESAEPLWRHLLELWCELTRRGCDPIRLRDHALITPACGLAGHGVSQAERALRLAREIGDRVHHQAAATKLTVGA